MNFLVIFVCLVFVRFSSESPVQGGDSRDDSAEYHDSTTTTTTTTTSSTYQETTTHPTFTGSNQVQRLDAPIERIEIRLIDENTTENTTPMAVNTQQEPPPTHAPRYEEHTTQMPTHLEPNDVIPAVDQSPAPPTQSAEQEQMYRKVEYVVQPTAAIESTVTTKYDNPVVVGEDASYYSTFSTPSERQSNDQIQAKAWISVSPSIPKFGGDIDEDDLPPPPIEETGSEEKEPEEECLANKEHLAEEVVERLKAEVTHYYRLVRQRNEQQKEYCYTENAKNIHSELFRRCSDWRAEKLVYYYKLMRKTYCNVENWPNPSKVKKTYGEYLNLFGTFYAFQK